ncbi:Insertion element protein [Haloechinothrix aidingensis]|uniref:Insertion element protein n=1 Tax=Haloechinothrix aidingensis TaxID=2752311 RepID=UPI001FE82ECE|nr:Insertion element protein [Haloechinothrix aidingensis]
MSERATPFHCPYCGDEDLRPTEEADTPGAWLCAACRRVFTVKLVGLSFPEGAR